MVNDELERILKVAIMEELRYYNQQAYVYKPVYNTHYVIP
jgi:hypothetical protein